MGALRLEIVNTELGVRKTMQFEPNTLVYDVCKLIRDKLGIQGNPNDYGLIRVEDIPSKSVWMENNRKLDYYMIRDGDTLEYRNKIRQLRVRTDGGAVKTIFVDESQPVSQLMITVCSKMGIANHEEYSLVRAQSPVGASRGKDHSHQQNGHQENGDSYQNGRSKDNAFLNTIGRKKEKQIQQLRAKLHTDEEIHWIDQSKTLREQQIGEDEELTLRRKYFFSDTNVDTRDPVQLNLLYLQCRDGVLSGVHPVSRDTAIKLAALQCYIEFGPFQEGVQRQLNVRELLPKEYAKAKEHEKNIAEEYREIIYEDQVAPKKKYCELCQSLPTYGVTFFLVKEKVPGKNRLIPRLLGVNKDSVMRVDERSKQVLKEWPLEQVRRWAAAPKTFTLDFGDYKDKYYSVQTEDSEKIAQLISGYIDIIIKKKRMADHLGIEGDEGSTMLEDVIAPARATLIASGQINPSHAMDGHVAMPGVLRSTSGTPSGGAQYGAVSGIVTQGELPSGQRIRYQNPRERAQRALIGTIEQTIRAVEEAEEEIMKPPQIDLPHFDTTNRRWRVEVEKEAVTDRLSAMNAATAEVVQLTAIPDDTDSRVGTAIATIGSNLPEVGRGVRELAGLMPDRDHAGDLIEATRRLMGAFGTFIDKVHPERLEKRSNILNAASHVGETTHDVINVIREETEEDRQFHDKLIKRAKDVATNTASLVMHAKTISSDCTEPAMREQIIHSATQTAFATSELVACARVVAPTIEHLPSQERLTDAAHNVARTVETLIQESNTAVQYSASGNGPRNLADIHAAARLVTNSLHDLIDHIKTSPRGQLVRKTQEEYNYEEIMRSSNRVITQQPQRDFGRDANNAIRHSRILVEQYETEAADAAPGQRDKLLNAARSVAQATSNMITATEHAQSRPQEAEAQMALKSAAEHLVQATNDAASGRLARQTFQRLEKAAKDTSAAATQAITAVNSAQKHIQTKRTVERLVMECSETGRYIPTVITSIKESQAATTPGDHFRAQSRLIHETQELLPPASRLVEASRAAIPEVKDGYAAENLQSTSQNLSTHLAELRVALNNAQQLNSAEQLEHYEDLIRELDEHLQQIGKRQKREGGTLGYDAQSQAVLFEQSLNDASRNLSSRLAQLIASSQSSDRQHVGASAADAGQSLRIFVNRVEDVAPTSKLDSLINGARAVVQGSGRVFGDVRSSAPYPQLKQSLDHVNESLRQTLASLPEQASIGDAIQKIQRADKQRPASPVDLRASATHLIETATGLVSGIRQGDQHDRVDEFVHAFINFNYAVRQYISQQLSGDNQLRREVEDQLEIARGSAIGILEHLRPAATDPSHIQAISQATRQLADSVGQIVAGGSKQESSWVQETDHALRQIDAVRPILKQPALAPVNENSYYESLEAVTEQAKRLGDGMSGMAHFAKHDDGDQLVHAIRQAADAVCGLSENAVQSAFLIGCGDPQSERGKAAPFDTNRLSRAIQAVKHVAQTIADGRYTQTQLINDTTTVATHSSTIATICRDASDLSNNVNIKKHFVHCARDITQATSSLISSVKQQDAAPNNAAYQRETAARARDLKIAAETLEAFVDRPEFAAGAAHISQNGLKAQQPVLESALQMLDASSTMIRTAKSLSNQPTDAAIWQKIADNSKIVSDSIKRLVATIREEAPGQADLEIAIRRLNDLIQQVDAASLAAAQQQLPKSSVTEQRVHQQILHAAQSLNEKLEPFKQAAQRHAEEIGHNVREHMNTIEPLVQSSIQAASLSYDAQSQAVLFDQCKTVVEAELELMLAAKDAGGNPKAVALHRDVDGWTHQVAEALKELQRSVNLLDSQAGVLHGVLDTLTRAITAADQSKQPTPHDSFPNVQTRMVDALEVIRQLANTMPVADANDLGSLSLKLCDAYRNLAEDSRIAHTLLTNPNLSQKLKVATQKLGTACIEIVKTGGQRRAHPYDERIQKQLYAASEYVIERIEEVLATLHEGSRGTQACINAANTVSGIIGDLDTTILFATSGSLNQAPPAQNPHRPLDAGEHRDTIVKTAKALVEDTKALVTGAASNQEQLAVAAQNAVRTIMNLSDAVRQGALALSNDSAESQVLIIHAVRDVAAALSNLIQATKNASGRNPQDPAMNNLKEAARSMVSNVTNLLKTIKSVEDRNQHGSYALDAATHAIDFAIKQYNNNELRVDKQATSEEVLRITRTVTEASKRATRMVSTQDQEQVIATANFARQAVAELLSTTLSAAQNAENADLKFRTIHAGREVALQVKELLMRLSYLLNRPGDIDAEKAILLASKEIAESVNVLAQCCDTLRTNSWPDGLPVQDPEAIAENELLGASASIEAASEKLKHMRPRHVQSHPEQEIQFDVHILDAAKSIAGAVSTLVRAASVAERELVAQNRNIFVGNQYQWSEGLVSAARAVAAAVQQLCEAANGLVQGHASEEKLISAAKQVAAHTAQLMVACRVRSDPESHGMRRLQSAGHAVRVATERLVKEASDKAAAEDERLLVISDRMVSGIAQVMNAQEEVLRKERELQEARRHLAAVHKSRYEKSPEPNE